MTRTHFAAFALLVSLAASCGESLTGPTELGPAPELTPPAPAPMLPAPAGPVEACPLTDELVRIEEGFTLEDLEETPELLNPYIDPVFLRTMEACAVANDLNPPEFCCPQKDSLGRGRSISTGYQPFRDEVYIWGRAPDIRVYPILLLTDEEGTVLYLQWAIDYFQIRPKGYPTDVPMYFWPLRDVPEEVRYGVHMCPGGHVLARVHGGVDSMTLRSVPVGERGFIWEFKRHSPQPLLGEG